MSLYIYQSFIQIFYLCNPYPYPCIYTYTYISTLTHVASTQVESIKCNELYNYWNIHWFTGLWV